MGRVTELQLRNHFVDNLYEIGKHKILGKISPSLFELNHLDYLDLSGNGFNGSSMQEFIGSLSKLRYLSLSDFQIVRKNPASAWKSHPDPLS